MLNWQEVPFVRLLIPFVLGLILANWETSDHYFSPVMWALLSLMYLLLFCLCQVRLIYQLRWLSGLIIMGLSFLTALACYQRQTPAQQAGHYIQQGDHLQYYLFRIESIKASKSGKSNRLELAILGYGKQPDSLSRVKGRSFCYLPADFLFSVGAYGLALGKLQKIAPPVHPGDFDFAHFMELQGMVRQLYIPDKRIYLLNKPPILSLRSRIVIWSAQLQQRLSQLLPSSSSGLVSALVLGQKFKLDPEVKADYARAGAMHVLAVSGLHVGIVALGLQFLLGFWQRSGALPKYLKAVIAVIGIWLFALIAGASASVIRAATMFSLFSLGRTLYLPKNVWNILAATALIMLCLDSRGLFSVGFQLSFSAVAAIVYFQPKLYRLWQIPYRSVDYFWQLLSLGLAAQLGTAALSIHYFHMFPLYFWLSGLIIVPLATLALLLGVVVLILGEVPLLGGLLITALHQLVQGMNKSMAWIAQLPSSSISPLYLSQTSTITILGIILGSVLYYHYRNRILAWVLLCLAGLLLWNHFAQVQESGQQKEYLIYASRSGLALSLVEGRSALTYASDGTVLKEITYAKNAYLLQKRTNVHAEHLMPRASQRIQWQDQNIVWFQQPIDSCAQVGQAPDLVLLGSSYHENHLLTLLKWQPKEVLLLHSLPFREKMAWENALKNQGIPLANLPHSNAFHKSLN